MTRLRSRRRFVSRRSQGGIVGVVALMFVIIVALFAMSQAAQMSASNITDSTRQADAVEALFLAESAIERVGYIFVNSTAADPCIDAEIGAPSGDFASGRGVYRVLGAFKTDFDGTTLLPTTMCRVRVQGEITGTKVTRTLESIVATDDDLISISSLNPNYNTTPYDDTRVDDEDNPPTNWSLTGGTQGMTYIAWDQNGGNDTDNSTCKTSGIIVCDRAAFARKTNPGSGTASAGGAFNTSGTPILITGPKVLRLTFDFRVWTRGNSQQEMQFAPRLVFLDGGGATLSYDPVGTAGGDCDVNGTVGTCESGPTAPGSPAWKGNFGNGCGYIDTPCFESGDDDPVACPTYNPDTSYNGFGGTTGSGGTYDECTGDGHNPPTGSTGYRTGYLTYNVSASGQLQLTSVSFTKADSSGALRGKDGQITWLWIDNLRLSVPGLTGGGPSKLWREVAAP